MCSINVAYRVTDFESITSFWEIKTSIQKMLHFLGCGRQACRFDRIKAPSPLQTLENTVGLRENNNTYI